MTEWFETILRQPSRRRNRHSSTWHAPCLGPGVFRRRRSRSLDVVLVSERSDTADGMRRYLAHAGVSSRTVVRMDDILSAARDADAVVAFPDDFQPSVALEALAALRAVSPECVLVIVTSHPARYQRLGARDPQRGVVVLPRPAWGWNILDSIRACLDGELTRGS